MKLAIVHDWLTNFGGAERLVLELHKLYPQAPIFTSVYEPKKVPLFKEADVRTTWLQKVPLLRHKHQLFPLLRARAFESLDLSDYDVVLSSTTAEAKAVKTGPNTLHVCYCNTPTRYYWSHYDYYLQNPGFGPLNPLLRLILPRQVKRMRRWDYLVAQKVDFFIGNSKHVSARIQKYYNRDSATIYPPVDVSRFKIYEGQRSGFLVVGRQVAYKRTDLAVKACTELNLPLTVVGQGSAHKSLQKIAGPSIRFIPTASDEEIANYYQKAEALIFPGEEDFGIVPVEAMACGTPVIAYGVGGATETVVNGSTGLYFPAQTVESLKHTLKQFNSQKFNPKQIRRQAERFSRERFMAEIKNFIETKYGAQGLND